MWAVHSPQFFCKLALSVDTGVRNQDGRPYRYSLDPDDPMKTKGTEQFKGIERKFSQDYGIKGLARN